MNTKVCAITFFISLSVAGCSDSPVSVNGVAQLFPLQVGNYWVYEYQRFDSAGHINDTATIVQSVDRDTIVYGGKYFFVKNWIPLVFHVSVWAVNKSDGFYAGLVPPDGLELTYKYPTWVGDLTVKTFDTLRVISMTSDQETPAGKFSCIVYQQLARSSLGLSYENDFISIGTGLVKIEVGTINGTVFQPTILILLTRYKNS